MMDEEHMDYVPHRKMCILLALMSAAVVSKVEGSIHAHIKVVCCIDR